MKFLDINNQDKNLNKKIISDIKKIINNCDFINGQKVNEFEIKFAKYCGSKFAIGCGNGTDAILLALKALNLKEGSEVILPAMTYCSTAFSVINAGLKPVLADISSKSSIVSYENIIKKINKNTKVILMVHLYGQSCDIKKLNELKKKYKLFIIEDASQAHGAYDNNGIKVGSYSDISCFSLYPGKNLGAYGDAGIVTTNRQSIFNKIKKLRNLGSSKKYHHDIVGFNSRLDTLQASILIHKLKNLDKNNNKRKVIANFYNKKINNDKIQKINYSTGCVFHQYVVIVKDIYNFMNYLKIKKIPFGRHYPFAIHQLTSLKHIFKNQKYPNSEKLAKYGVSLPIDPYLTKKNLIKIVNTINKFK
tara:strand:+ start:5596 stop:6681 length:1086 start_codon:yes stop_codon:yes gene_type:complete